jgi:hypothetical protein
MNTETITEDKFPSNGGWKFRQPQFNWENPMALVGFKASVNAIVQVRQKNKALSVKHNLSTDPNAVGAELKKFNAFRLGIPDQPSPSFFQGRRSNPLSEDGAAAGVSKWNQFRRAGNGAATLGDWLGKGGIPVATELATARAAVCIGCPQNKSGDLLSFFTKPVSELIRRQLEERLVLKLATSHDAKLGICFACGCPLKLKVHVPVAEIRAHMQETESGQLDPGCWIPKEP